MRVDGEDAQSNVKAASLALQKAALDGEKWVPIVGAIEFQQLTDGATAKSEEFLMAMQGLDNYRRKLLGISNGGMFQKDVYQTVDQSEMNNSSQEIALTDGLEQRQNFCDIANKIFGLNMEVDTNEIMVSEYEPTMSEYKEEEPSE